jgi:hypothetical protein
MVTLKVVHPLKMCQNTVLHGPTLTGKVLHPPTKFHRPPFGMVEATALKGRASKLPPTVDSLTEFHKIY